MIDLPGKGNATYLRQAGIYRSDIRALGLGMQGDGVLEGLGVTAQGSPNMTVAVAAGMVRIGGYFAFVSAVSSLTITTAHASLDRMDLVVCDYNGTVSLSAGTAAANPLPPVVPANSVPLAQLYIPANDTAVVTDQIWDRRPVVVDYYDDYAEFNGSSLSATVATSAGSLGECSWTMSSSGTAGAPTFQTSTDKHPGVLRQVSGATSGNNTRMHYGSASNSAIFHPSNIARQRHIVSIPTITTGSWKIGLGQDLSDAAAGTLGTAGAFIEFVPATSAKWRYTTRQASASTTNADTGADVVAGNWYDFQIIRKQNNNYQFIKNGALMFEHSANQPSTVCNIGVLNHTLTAAARNIDHDFFGLNLAPLGNRWT